MQLDLRKRERWSNDVEDQCRDSFGQTDWIKAVYQYANLEPHGVKQDEKSNRR